MDISKQEIIDTYEWFYRRLVPDESFPVGYWPECAKLAMNFTLAYYTAKVK